MSRTKKVQGLGFGRCEARLFNIHKQESAGVQIGLLNYCPEGYLLPIFNFYSQRKNELETVRQTTTYIDNEISTVTGKGKCEGNCQAGQGTMTWSDRSNYEGEWKDNKKNQFIEMKQSLLLLSKLLLAQSFY